MAARKGTGKRKKAAAPKRRAGASFVDRLMSRVGIEKASKKLGVSERTIKGWQKQGPPAARRDEVEGVWHKAERAQRANEERRAQRDRERAEIAPRGFVTVVEPSEFTRKQDRAFRRAQLFAKLEGTRQEIEDIDAEDSGDVEAAYNPRERARRRLMQVFDDRAALDRMVREVANEGEFSSRELYTMFFSPEVA